MGPPIHPLTKAVTWGGDFAIIPPVLFVLFVCVLVVCCVLRVVCEHFAGCREFNKSMLLLVLVLSWALGPFHVWNVYSKVTRLFCWHWPNLPIVDGQLSLQGKNHFQNQSIMDMRRRRGGKRLERMD